MRNKIHSARATRRYRSHAPRSIARIALGPEFFEDSSSSGSSRQPSPTGSVRTWHTSTLMRSQDLSLAEAGRLQSCLAISLVDKASGGSRMSTPVEQPPDEFSIRDLSPSALLSAQRDYGPVPQTHIESAIRDTLGGPPAEPRVTPVFENGVKLSPIKPLLLSSGFSLLYGSQDTASTPMRTGPIQSFSSEPVLTFSSSRNMFATAFSPFVPTHSDGEQLPVVAAAPGTVGGAADAQPVPAAAKQDTAPGQKPLTFSDIPITVLPETHAAKALVFMQSRSAQSTPIYEDAGEGVRPSQQVLLHRLTSDYAGTGVGTGSDAGRQSRASTIVILPQKSATPSKYGSSFVSSGTLKQSFSAFPAASGAPAAAPGGPGGPGGPGAAPATPFVRRQVLGSTGSVAFAVAGDAPAQKFTIAGMSLGALLRDHNGCKILDQFFAENARHTRALIRQFICENSPGMESVLVHQSGNYSFQKIYEHCNAEERAAILTVVSPHLFAVSLDVHGTRSIQKVIERSATPAERAIIIANLRRDSRVVHLILNINGNHCAQRCIEVFTPEECEFIYDQVEANLIDVATHQHGCCVLQKCIGAAGVVHKVRLIQRIIESALLLVQDKYGNYVYQYALDLLARTEGHVLHHEGGSDGSGGPGGGSVALDSLVERLYTHEISLMRQKFSSHPLEKSIAEASPRLRGLMIDEILSSPEFVDAVTDKFGNYVVQRIFGICSVEQRRRIARTVLGSAVVTRCIFSRNVVQMCEAFAREHGMHA